MRELKQQSRAEQTRPDQTDRPWVTAEPSGADPWDRLTRTVVAIKGRFVVPGLAGLEDMSGCRLYSSAVGVVIGQLSQSQECPTAYGRDRLRGWRERESA